MLEHMGEAALILPSAPPWTLLLPWMLSRPARLSHPLSFPTCTLGRPPRSLPETPASCCLPLPCLALLG